MNFEEIDSNIKLMIFLSLLFYVLIMPGFILMYDMKKEKKIVLHLMCEKKKSCSPSMMLFNFNTMYYS